MLARSLPLFRDAESSPDELLVLAACRLAFGLLLVSQTAISLMPFSQPTVFGAPALVLFGLNLAFILGWQTRMTAFGCGIFVVLFHLRGLPSVFDHHFVLFLGLVIGLLGFARTDEHFSVRPSRAEGVIAVLPLLRLQVITVYFYAVINKMSPEYLSGFRLEQLLLYSYGGSFGHVPPVLVTGMTWAGLLVEVALIPLLVVPRWRRAGVALGLFFHATLFLTFNVGEFTPLMLVLLLLFLEPTELAARLRAFMNC